MVKRFSTLVPDDVDEGKVTLLLVPLQPNTVTATTPHSAQRNKQYALAIMPGLTSEKPMLRRTL
jgi:hypothetical protein